MAPYIPFVPTEAFAIATEEEWHNAIFQNVNVSDEQAALLQTVTANAAESTTGRVRDWVGRLTLEISRHYDGYLQSLLREVESLHITVQNQQALVDSYKRQGKGKGKAKDAEAASTEAKKYCVICKSKTHNTDDCYKLAKNADKRPKTQGDGAKKAQGGSGYPAAKKAKKTRVIQVELTDSEDDTPPSAKAVSANTARIEEIVEIEESTLAGNDEPQLSAKTEPIAATSDFWKNLLDRDARAWATPYFAQLASVQMGVQGVTTPFRNEAAFTAAFKARFGNLDDEVAAQVELAKLCADKSVCEKHTAVEFSALFKGPADRSGYGDLELHDKYLSGIPSRVYRKIELETFTTWLEAEKRATAVEQILNISRARRPELNNFFSARGRGRGRARGGAP
ncbi:predicted protein [Postia placenta Mad-698-R]|nr:predicted protein [Postia placenta Mad-698-R]